MFQTDGSFEKEETLRVVVNHISPLNNNCNSGSINYFGLGVLFSVHYVALTKNSIKDDYFRVQTTIVL